MKKFAMVLCAVMLVFGVYGIAGATFIETVDVYQYSIGGNIGWDHTYDFSETTPIYSATLTIVADDVDGPGNNLNGEQDDVYLNGILLGTLTMLPNYTNWGYVSGPGGNLTTTIFDLNVTLLDWTMPVLIEVETEWGVEIETSTLTIQGAGAPVPEPSTILLMGIGLLGLVGYNRKRFSKKS